MVKMITMSGGKDPMLLERSKISIFNAWHAGNAVDMKNSTRRLDSWITRKASSTSKPETNMYFLTVSLVLDPFVIA